MMPTDQNVTTAEDHADQSPVSGYARMGHPRVSGALVGTVGGCVPIALNSAALPGPWTWSLRALGLAVLVRRRPLPALPPPDRTGALVYIGGVIGMLAIMFGGIRWLEATGQEGLEPAVVALAVGAYFLPYARAFAAPVFLWLGAGMVVLGLVGLALALTTTVLAAPAYAVAAGLVLLIGSAIEALRP